jgi:hypothetical protein
VTVQYRWHSLYGSKLKLVKTAKSAGVEELHCETLSGIVLGMPRWMTDAGRCSVMEIGDPVVGVSALAELRRLLDGLKSH